MWDPDAPLRARRLSFHRRGRRKRCSDAATPVLSERARPPRFHTVHGHDSPSAATETPCPMFAHRVSRPAAAPASLAYCKGTDLRHMHLPAYDLERGVCEPRQPNVTSLFPQPIPEVEDKETFVTEAALRVAGGAAIISVALQPDPRLLATNYSINELSNPLIIVQPLASATEDGSRLGNRIITYGRGGSPFSGGSYLPARHSGFSATYFGTITPMPSISLTKGPSGKYLLARRRSPPMQPAITAASTHAGHSPCSNDPDVCTWILRSPSIRIAGWRTPMERNFSQVSVQWSPKVVMPVPEGRNQHDVHTHDGSLPKTAGTFAWNGPP
ncbi:hypothetical protein EVG20_g2097 [Dentipellis fragilis]|uniref:Uncharacterized protein n=1 Tax=Dentipellis fragilis TaxID=205917 RepID=A0A4Y9Z808_9AGAM|nr:hypothetical protein EVG20_g2097 [Dentipellis fragilis]